MQAVQHKVKDCILDKEGNIHVLLTDNELNFFSPMYVSVDQGELLLMIFDDDIPDEINHLMRFLVDTWTKLGYITKSIVIDHNGDDGILLPTMTFMQNQFDQRHIYLTCFVPITAAFLLSSCFDIPIYITTRAQSVLKRFPIDQMSEYIETVKVKEDENEKSN